MHPVLFVRRDLLFPHHLGHDAKERAAIEVVGTVGENGQFKITKISAVHEESLSIEAVWARSLTRAGGSKTRLHSCYFKFCSRKSSIIWYRCARSLPVTPCVFPGYSMSRNCLPAWISELIIWILFCRCTLSSLVP